MQNWGVIASEIINVAAAIFFILFFSIYLCRIKRLSESERFVHLYPYRRIIFVVLYILINIVEVVIFIVLPISQSGVFNTIQLYFLIGTCLNSCILGYELFILYVQIKKQKPFHLIHLVYWFYLACISLMRLILEAYFQKGQDVNTSELVLSSLLFSDALILFVYSCFMKRYEFQQYQSMAEKRFSMLNKPSVIQLKKYQLEDEIIFPYLAVNVKLHQNQSLIIKIVSNYQQISTIVKSPAQLQSFYNDTIKFKLTHKLDFQKRELNIIQLQQFFSELLSNWQNYEPFVLEFFNVNEQYKKQINRCRSQKSAYTHQSTKYDRSIIYFDVKLPSMVNTGDHYEFDISVWTNDKQCNRTVHKRYSQFEELDKTLKSFDYKGFRLRTPQLPQKIYFKHNQEKMSTRKNKLQLYIKRLLNDKLFVKKYKQTRLALFEFFRLDTQQFALVKQVPMPFDFSQISYQKGSLVRQMATKNEPYVVYYYFDVMKNGNKIGEFKNRFSAFEQFNHQLKRWMYNTQTQYKSIKFPIKIPHSSQPQKHKRHIQLTQYLNTLVYVIPNLSQFYEARKFLLQFQQITVIQTPSLSKRSSSSKSHKNQQISNSDRSHMSQLIDNLQFDENNI